VIVKLRLKGVKYPICYNAAGSYAKGPFYCVRMQDGTVVKTPIRNIFQVIEDYGYHAPKGDPALESD